MDDMSISAVVTVDTANFQQQMAECQKSLRQMEAFVLREADDMAERVASICESSRVKLKMLEIEIEKVSQAAAMISTSVPSGGIHGRRYQP